MSWDVRGWCAGATLLHPSSAESGVNWGVLELTGWVYHDLIWRGAGGMAGSRVGNGWRTVVPGCVVV